MEAGSQCQIVDQQQGVFRFSNAVSPVCRVCMRRCVAWEVDDKTVGTCRKRVRTALAVVSSMQSHRVSGSTVVNSVLDGSEC
jgi:hypothetical protein